MTIDADPLDSPTAGLYTRVTVQGRSLGERTYPYSLPCQHWNLPPCPLEDHFRLSLVGGCADPKSLCAQAHRSLALSSENA